MTWCVVLDWYTASLPHLVIARAKPVAIHCESVSEPHCSNAFIACSGLPRPSLRSFLAMTWCVVLDWYTPSLPQIVIARAKPVAIHCEPEHDETTRPRDARQDGLPQRTIDSARVVDLHLGVALDFFAHSGQSVSSVGRKVLSDAHLSKEIGFHTHDILGSFIAV